MAPRNLPAIKRIRQTRYVASDNRAFDSHVEAFRHETFIALQALLSTAIYKTGGDAEEIARILLAAADFRIVLLGPKTPVRETGQGPAGPLSAPRFAPTTGGDRNDE